MHVWNYFNNTENKKILIELNNILKIQNKKIVRSKSIFDGKNIVFTGKLTNLSREEAKEKALQLGAKILSTISPNTDYLICGEKPGSKIIKAKDLKVKILNENEWIKMIN